jgi:hypothetical protein
MVGPVQVDIVALAAVAGAVEGSAATLGRAHRAHLAPGPALDGWATGAVLARGVDGWDAFLRDLHGQVREFGAGLRRSAADYRASDERAAGRGPR